VYIHRWEKPERKSNRSYDLALFLPAFNILIHNGYIHFCSLEFTDRKTIVATALSGVVGITVNRLSELLLVVQDGIVPGRRQRHRKRSQTVSKLRRNPSFQKCIEIRGKRPVIRDDGLR